MSRYWILDREESPQGFPLGLLISKICEATGATDGELRIRRSQGYGAQVCHWDELLDRADEIPVAFEDLARISQGTDEWFFDLDAVLKTPSASVGFGVHDSSALFLDAPPPLAEKVTAAFKQVRHAEDS